MQRSYFCPWRGVLWSVLAFALMCSSGCSRNANSSSSASNCDDAHLNATASQGYALLNSGDLYKAHLVGHELMTMGHACGNTEVAVSSTIQGEYIMAYIGYERGDRAQSTRYTTMGMNALEILKQHRSENPAYAELYDQMQPRFAALDVRLR